MTTRMRTPGCLTFNLRRLQVKKGKSQRRHLIAPHRVDALMRGFNQRRGFPVKRAKAYLISAYSAFPQSEKRSTHRVPSRLRSWRCRVLPKSAQWARRYFTVCRSFGIQCSTKASGIHQPLWPAAKIASITATSSPRAPAACLLPRFGS
jgi:hypothetical protein